MQVVATSALETADFADRSRVELDHMESAMEHMASASKTVSERLTTIQTRANNITSVIGTITKVADQTNLLSLNASIEAEKAGEYGRGFTVVAAEIRRLADQTAVATLDIEDMVKEMLTAVASGVEETDRFIKAVQRSVEGVGHIGQQMNQIINQVQELSPNFEQVNVAVSQQSLHSREISQALLRLEEESGQTAASLHETMLAIEQINETSRHLKQQMERFKINPKGDSAE
jgi:methyl-accepting chemotaxis protein WspA